VKEREESVEEVSRDGERWSARDVEADTPFEHPNSSSADDTDNVDSGRTVNMCDWAGLSWTRPGYRRPILYTSL